MFWYVFWVFVGMLLLYCLQVSLVSKGDERGEVEEVLC